MNDAHGDPGAEWLATSSTAGVIARTGYRILTADGPDMLGLLSRLSTGPVSNLTEGSGAQTVLTTAKGRVIERLWVHLASDGLLWLIGGHGSAQPLLDHFKRFTFTEQIGLRDRSCDHALFSVVGPLAHELRSRWLNDPQKSLEIAASSRIRGGWILGHDAHGTDGWSLLVRNEDADEAWDDLVTDVKSVGGLPVGSSVAECWRICAGLPAIGHEIDERWNPLEAGLGAAVSFDKGCYIGQEVVARLKNYDKVSRSLVLLRWDGNEPFQLGNAIRHGNARLGILTSAVDHPDGGQVGLALVKHRDLSDDTSLTLQLADGPVPLRWERLESDSSA